MRTGLSVIPGIHSPRSIDPNKSKQLTGWTAQCASVLHFDGLTGLHWSAKLLRLANSKKDFKRKMRDSRHRGEQVLYLRDRGSEVTDVFEMHLMLKSLPDTQVQRLKEQTEHLRKAFAQAGPKVRRNLIPLLPDEHVNFEDVTLNIRPRDNFTERQIWLNAYPPEMDSLQQALSLVRGKRALVLDIGANCGAYTLPLAHAAAPGSRVIAFEPNPEMIGRLGENVALNKLGSVVRIEGCALGAEEGEAVLRQRFGNLGQATLKGVRGGKDSDTVVPVRRLAPFLNGAGDYDFCFLKIDVEGFEDRVMQPWLEVPEAAYKPDAILIETAHKKKWSVDIPGALEKLGYRTDFKGEGNTLFVLGGPDR